MIAALLASTKVCVGPKVARRHLTVAKVSGATKDDVVRIFNDSDTDTMIVGSGELPLPAEGRMIQVEHKKASGNPVTVELVR